MMAKADATHVVVIERAHADTIKMVVNAGKDLGVKVMGDISRRRIWWLPRADWRTLAVTCHPSYWSR
jgi:3-keto-L-gulonate-6-phosphate decarboxylase